MVSYDLRHVGVFFITDILIEIFLLKLIFYSKFSERCLTPFLYIATTPPALIKNLKKFSRLT